MANIFEERALRQNNQTNNIFEDRSLQNPEFNKKPDTGKYFVKGAVKETSTFPQKIQNVVSGQPVLNSLLELLGLEKKQDLMKETVTQPFENLVSQTLEKKAPSSEQTRPYEEYGQRYAQQAPFNPLLGLLTAGSGQIAKEKGFGPVGQAVAEIVTGGVGDFAKNLMSKGITPPKDLKDLYNFGKSMGISDKNMTPLMQSERKIKWISKLAQKGKRANEALKGTHEALGETYKNILNSADAQKALNPNQAMKFANHVKKLTSTMPYDLREAIRNDAFELAKNGFKGNELMNFWKDIGYQVSQGNKELGILKEPIANALRDINPKLGQDFVKINNLYSRYYDIIKAMKPSLYTELENGGKLLYLIKNLWFFNPKALAGEGVYQGAKSFARETLINPKFQNITKKLISALNKNKYSSANMIFQEMNKVIKKDSPELADELKDIDFTDLEKNQSEKK